MKISQNVLIFLVTDELFDCPSTENKSSDSVKQCCNLRCVKRPCNLLKCLLVNQYDPIYVCNDENITCQTIDTHVSTN